MADNNEDQEIEEPAQLVEQIPHQQPTDHIPLKDEFSSDLSDIEFLDVPQKQVQQLTSQKAVVSKPKKKKIVKSFQWKQKWVSYNSTQVKQANAVQGSPPICIKRWVKVKYVPNEQDLVDAQQQQQAEKDKGTLELAHAIILEQMNNKS